VRLLWYAIIIIVIIIIIMINTSIISIALTTQRITLAHYNCLREKTDSK